MSYQVEITEVPTQPAAVVRGHVQLSEISDFVGNAFAEVMSVAEDQELKITGPPFARYRAKWDGFEVEAGFPTSEIVLPSRHVRAIELPAGPVAQVMHRGDYSAVAAAYDAITEWEQQNGYEASGEPWESYLDGPEVAEPRTIVTAPCHRIGAP